MKHVLLTNIGNRNLKLDGQYLDLKNNDGKNFKEYTKELFDQLVKNYDQLRSRLSLEIIPNWLAEIECAILFATDQNNDFAFQDTLYEAKILELILEKDEGIKVDIMTFSGNPADEFSTYRFFSAILREFREAGREEFYIINDAGGTPHMKQALKDLCEFFFSDRHKVVYTNQQDQKHDVNRWIAKKYTLLATIAEFIKNYDYLAASFLVKRLEEQLYKNEVPPLSDELTAYINIVANRINFNEPRVKDILIDIDTSLKLKNNPILITYTEQRSYELTDSIKFAQLSKKAKHDIFEIASICQLFFRQNNYTVGVATLYRFMEELCQSFIESEGKYKLNSKKDRLAFIECVKSVVTSTFKSIIANEGLPFYLSYVLIKARGELLPLLNILRELTSNINKKRVPNKGINLLRNHCFLAHDNQPITKEILDEEFPNLLENEKWLEQIFVLCNLPEKNIYDQMNEEILELLYNE